MMARPFSLSSFVSVACLCSVVSASLYGHPPFRRTVPVPGANVTSASTSSSSTLLLPHLVLPIHLTWSTTSTSSSGPSSQTDIISAAGVASVSGSDTPTQSSPTATSSTNDNEPSDPLITSPPNFDLSGLDTLPPEVSSYIVDHSLYSIDWSNVVGFEDGALVYGPSPATSYSNSSTRCSTFWEFPEPTEEPDPSLSTETITVAVTVYAPPPTFCRTLTFTPDFPTTQPPPTPSFAFLIFQNGTNATVVKSAFTARPTHKTTVTNYIIPADSGGNPASGEPGPPPIQKIPVTQGPGQGQGIDWSAKPSAPPVPPQGQTDDGGKVDTAGTKDSGKTDSSGGTGSTGGGGQSKVAGTSGNSGTSGNTGNSGSTGNSGNTGNSGSGNTGSTGSTGNSGSAGNSGSNSDNAFNAAVASAIGRLFPGSAPSGGSSGSSSGSNSGGSSSGGSQGGSTGNSGSSSGGSSSGGSSGSNSSGGSTGLGAFIASIFGGNSASNSGNGSSGGGTGNTATPPAQGQVNGVTYSVAPNSIVVNGVTYSPIVPQTINLPNGQSAAIGPQGLSIGNTFIPISSSGTSGSGNTGSFGGPPAQGTINGVSYSVGPNAIVVGGQTFSPSQPTTVALPGGHTATIGPNGFSVDNSFVPIDAGGSLVPSQGVVNGVPYSFTPGGIIVAGTTYSTSQPTTVTLPNGQTLVIGPGGSVAIGGINIPSPTTGFSGSGTTNGVSYTISPAGITIGGTTYPLSTPTTVTLPGGQILVIGSDGSASIGGVPILIPNGIKAASTTAAASGVTSTEGSTTASRTASSTTSPSTTSPKTTAATATATSTTKPKKNAAGRERDIICLGTVLVVGLSTVAIMLL